MTVRGRTVRPWLLPWLALGALSAVRAGVVDERDPYWQVRAGLENLSGAPLSRPDTWSWDPVPGPFTQTSPGWNDVLGLAWRAAGFLGFFTIALASMLLYVAVVLALARRLGARPLPTLVGVLGTLLLALPMVSPRATLVAQTLFLAALLGADRVRAVIPRWPVAGVAAAGAGVGAGVAWAGMWMHLSWLLLAPALWTALLAMSLAAPIGGRARGLAVLGGSGVGLAAGVLAGPYGTEAWALSRTVQGAASGVVLEWMPPFADGLAWRWVPVAVTALVGTAAGAVWVLRRRQSKDPRAGLAAGLLVLGGPAAVGGLFGIRFLGLSLLALAPLAALGATALADRAHRRAEAAEPTGIFRSDRVRRWTDGHPWRVALTMVLVVVSPLVLFAGARLGRPPEADALGALPTGCRLFSDPASAGPVLLLRPDVTVWVDTRADYWGRERNARALAVLTGHDTSVPALAGADCALLSGSADLPTAGLASALDTDPLWQRGADSRGVRVWLRVGAGR